MDQDLNAFFDELQRRSQRLLAIPDNEALRHDLLVRPVLTSPIALGWEAGEALSQIETPLDPTVQESYYWRNATPKKKRPDIVLLPYNVGRVVGVVEEKRHQATFDDLQAHSGQLLEYQYLHRCVWGLLTDGQKWLLMKNHEVFHRFEDLADLKARLSDLKHCIGREALMDRLRRFGTADLVHVQPSPAIMIVGTIGGTPKVTNLLDYLASPTRQGRDLVHFLYSSLRNEVFRRLDKIHDIDTRSFLRSLYGSGFGNYACNVVMAAELLLMSEYRDNSDYRDTITLYGDSIRKWAAKYPVFQAHATQLASETTFSFEWLMQFCMEVDYFPVWGHSKQFLDGLKEYCIRSLASPQSVVEIIEKAIVDRRERESGMHVEQCTTKRPTEQP